MSNLKPWYGDKRIQVKHKLETRRAIQDRILDRGDYYRWFVRKFGNKDNSAKYTLIALAEMFCLLRGFIPHTNIKYMGVQSEH